MDEEVILARLAMAQFDIGKCDRDGYKWTLRTLTHTTR